MNPRHLRKPLRHAMPARLPAGYRNALPYLHGVRQRFGRMRLLSAVLIGAAAVAATAWGQPAGTTADRTGEAAVVALSSASGDAVRGQTLPEGTAGQPASSPDGRAETPAASRNERRGAQESAAAPTEQAQPSPATKDGAASTGSPAAATSPSAAASAESSTKDTQPAPAAKEVYHQYQVQTTGYYCGPAAARIAVTAHGLYPSQDEMARRLNTTVSGTFSSDEVTRALNELLGASTYHTTWIPAKPSTEQQRDQLQADVVQAVSNGHPVVMNIVGTARDLGGASHSYSGGHYVTVVAYRDSGQQVKIADPAYANGKYWIDIAALADWAGGRGYAS